MDKAIEILFTAAFMAVGLLIALGAIFLFLSYNGKISPTGVEATGKGKNDIRRLGNRLLNFGLFGLFVLLAILGISVFPRNPVPAPLPTEAIAAVPTATNTAPLPIVNTETQQPTQTVTAELSPTSTSELTLVATATEWSGITVFPTRPPTQPPQKPPTNTPEPPPPPPPPSPTNTQAPPPTNTPEPLPTNTPEPPQPPTEGPNKAFFKAGEPYLGCDRVNVSMGNLSSAEVVIEGEMYLEGEQEPISSWKEEYGNGGYLNLGFGDGVQVHYTGDVYSRFRYSDPTTGAVIAEYEYNHFVDCP